jgi:hypothetical protein
MNFTALTAPGMDMPGFNPLFQISPQGQLRIPKKRLKPGVILNN